MVSHHAAYVTYPLRFQAFWHSFSNKAMTQAPYQMTSWQLGLFLSTRNQARKTQLIFDAYPLRASAVRWWNILCLATWINICLKIISLSHLQPGFRANILNQHCEVDALLLNFSKAFDKVSHTKLLHKLAHCGINGKTLAWIAAFLLNRTQFVVVNVTHSTTTPVTSCVPQGYVLGPTLFLLFINDITQVTNSQLRLFADDTLLYRTINSLHDHQVLQEDLLNVTKWASD